MRKNQLMMLAAGTAALSIVMTAVSFAGMSPPTTTDGIGIYRPSGGGMLSVVSPDRSGSAANLFYKLFGGPGDVIVVGDWDGDGTKTFGAFRDDGNGNGLWILDFTGNGSLTYQLFGSPTDIPVVGDWDPNSAGDEIGVARPDAPNMLLEWILADNTPVTGFSRTSFGANTDVPVPGEWNNDPNDGSDLGVTRDASGSLLWITQGSGGLTFALWGAAGDTATQGDYTGDGNSNYGVRSTGGAGNVFVLDASPTEYVPLGVSTDTPFNPSTQGQP